MEEIQLLQGSFRICVVIAHGQPVYRHLSIPDGLGGGCRALGPGPIGHSSPQSKQKRREGRKEREREGHRKGGRLTFINVIVELKNKFPSLSKFFYLS